MNNNPFIDPNQNVHDLADRISELPLPEAKEMNEMVLELRQFFDEFDTSRVPTTEYSPPMKTKLEFIDDRITEVIAEGRVLPVALLRLTQLYSLGNQKGRAADTAIRNNKWGKLEEDDHFVDTLVNMANVNMLQYAFPSVARPGDYT